MNLALTSGAEKRKKAKTNGETSKMNILYYIIMQSVNGYHFRSVAVISAETGLMSLHSLSHK